MPLSLVNDYLYCKRRAALKLIDGSRASNVHTNRGDVVHTRVDLPGYATAKGVKLLRALPVFSDKLGLNGKCDIVEQWPANVFIPVEFKVSKREQWDNDDVQLCAQALCLEEMFQTTVTQGAVFHAESKRRRTVAFTPELRGQTITAIEALHILAETVALPSAVLKAACEDCTLYDLCLPQLTSLPGTFIAAKSKLFEV